MAKRIWGITLISCLLLVGCGGRSSSSGDGASNYTIGGSTSVQPLMEHMSEKYNEVTGTRVSVQGGGSSVGTKGTIDGTFDVGMVSRELKDDEIGKLDTTIIAFDGIVVIINKENPVMDVSLDEVKKIFIGEITNWKEVGGEDKEIAVVSREEGSGTRDGFESIVGFETTSLVNNADIQNATGSIISAVSGNKQAIGYISLGSISNQIKLVSIEGVQASEETIKEGSYQLRRPFTLCLKKDSEEAKTLFDFIFSDEGEAIIKEYNYIPVERFE